MSGIYDMTPWSLRTAVTPDTVKIMKDFWHFRVRAWNFLQNDIQNYVFWLIHSWEIALQSQIFDIFFKKAQKKALALKGLKWKSILGNVICYKKYITSNNVLETFCPVFTDIKNDHFEIVFHLHRSNWIGLEQIQVCAHLPKCWHRNQSGLIQNDPKKSWNISILDPIHSGPRK